MFQKSHSDPAGIIDMSIVYIYIYIYIYIYEKLLNWNVDILFD